MKEITQDNYKDLEFNFYGIVIAYPKIDLYFNAEFYFIKQKIDHDTDERYYITCGYNEEDKTCEGLAPDRLKTTIENTFNWWSEMNYYQFENMEEFCEWYIHKDDKLKESIDKFKKETKEFQELLQNKNHETIKSYSNLKEIEGKLKLYSPKEIRDIMNPGWNTRRQELQDVLKLLELRDLRQNTIDMLVENMPPEKRCYLEKQLERDEKRIEDFLNERIY